MESERLSTDIYNEVDVGPDNSIMGSTTAIPKVIYLGKFHYGACHSDINIPPYYTLMSPYSEPLLGEGSAHDPSFRLILVLAFTDDSFFKLILFEDMDSTTKPVLSVTPRYRITAASHEVR